MNIRKSNSLVTISTVTPSSVGTRVLGTSILACDWTSKNCWWLTRSSNFCLEPWHQRNVWNWDIKKLLKFEPDRQTVGNLANIKTCTWTCSSKDYRELRLVNFTSKESRENVFKIGHQKIIWCWLGKHQNLYLDLLIIHQKILVKMSSKLGIKRLAGVGLILWTKNC